MFGFSLRFLRNFVRPSYFSLCTAESISVFSGLAVPLAGLCLPCALQVKVLLKGSLIYVYLSVIVVLLLCFATQCVRIYCFLCLHNSVIYFRICISFFVNYLLYTFSLSLIRTHTYTVEPLITDTAGEFKFCPL
jgi:hypothetical protein